MKQEQPYQMLCELFDTAEINILKEEIKQLVLTAVIETLEGLKETWNKL